MSPVLDTPIEETTFERSAVGAPAGSRAVTKVSTILVPLDFDDRSRSLLERATEVASQFGAKLVLLHVCSPISHAPAHLTAHEFERWQSVMLQNARKNLIKAQEEFSYDPAVRDAEIVVARGFLEREILSIARRVQADLIMISTHGYLGVKHLLLGSKAERLVRRSHCSVLIVPQS